MMILVSITITGGFRLPLHPRPPSFTDLFLIPQRINPHTPKNTNRICPAFRKMIFESCPKRFMRFCKGVRIHIMPAYHREKRVVKYHLTSPALFCYDDGVVCCLSLI